MAISIYGKEDLIRIATMPTKLVSMKMAGKSVKEVLLLRRNLQISLTAYSKIYPAKNGRLDPVHAGIIWVMKQIEMRAREAFMKHYFPRMWPESKRKGMSKLSLKIDLKKQWESILKKASF